jgi:AcrR family transcriptional regulator
MIIMNKSSHPPTVKSTNPPKRKSSSPPRTSPTVPLAGAKRNGMRYRLVEMVAVATRLFAERGYEGASMGDLAERVGLRKASLFHHFASKEVLYATVLTQLMERLKSAVVSATMVEGTLAERLDGLTDALTSTLSAQPHAARLLMREAMDAGTVLKGSLGKGINDQLTAAVELAKLGQREGTFNPELDPTHAIVSLIGIHFVPFVIGDIVERLTGTSPFDASFVEARKGAVRMQVRDLMLAKKKK